MFTRAHWNSAFVDLVEAEKNNIVPGEGWHDVYMIKIIWVRKGKVSWCVNKISPLSKQKYLSCCKTNGKFWAWHEYWRGGIHYHRTLGQSSFNGQVTTRLTERIYGPRKSLLITQLLSIFQGVRSLDNSEAGFAPKADENAYRRFLYYRSLWADRLFRARRKYESMMDKNYDVEEEWCAGRHNTSTARKRQLMISVNKV